MFIKLVGYQLALHQNIYTATEWEDDELKCDSDTRNAFVVYDKF